MVKINSRKNLEVSSPFDGIKIWVHLDNQQVSVAEAELEIGAIEPMHYHEKSIQNILVIDGKAQFYVGGTEYELRKGQSLVVQSGVHHNVTNVGKEKLLLQVTSQPSAADDRVLV